MQQLIKFHHLFLIRFLMNTKHGRDTYIAHMFGYGFVCNKHKFLDNTLGNRANPFYNLYRLTIAIQFNLDLGKIKIYCSATHSSFTQNTC